MEYYEVDTNHQLYHSMMSNCGGCFLSLDGNFAIVKVLQTQSHIKALFNDYNPISQQDCLTLRRSDKYQNKIL